MTPFFKEMYQMTMQRRSGAAKHVLSPAVLCCLWVFAVPADASAQKFNNPTCTVQSVTMGGVTTWQIKGTTTVTGLIAVPNSTSVHVTVQFQRKQPGFNWVNLFSVTQATGANNGTANIDTGFQDLSPGPNQGDQYRIVVSGTWGNNGPPVQNGNIPAATSPAITPIP